jgi:tRNA pseudouridine13 synthase
LKISKLERELGIEVYASKSPGIGGKIKQAPEDFIVQEILSNGSKAEIELVKPPQINGRGRYLICTLIKRNWDTILAVKTIANKLDVDSERIQIAGIKDARAVTAQHISIGRMMPEQISEIKIRDITLIPLCFSDEKLYSGRLLGNDFHITMRSIAHFPSKIEERMKNVKNELNSLGGIPNFFGHQRFGTIRVITHLVGKHIVLGEWEDAAFTFLSKPSEHEHPESRQAREQLFKTQNFREALKYFPNHLRYERIMLYHLARHPKDFVGAFQRLPTKLCKLFVQAYQSYLFNRFLSQKMKQSIPFNVFQNGAYTITFDGQKRPALPLIGFKQSYSLGIQGEIEKRVLEKEKVTPQNFNIPLMRKISATGGLRTVTAPINNLTIGEPSKDLDNLPNYKISVEFTLYKGSYATIVLRELMKPANLVKAGF